MTGTTWSSKMLYRLRVLHAEGVPFERIAARLNAEFNTALTKNACVGKAYRLNLPARQPGPEPIRVSSRQIDMLELTPRTCRWPEGDRVPYTFCGAPVDGERQYCSAHCRRAYEGSRQRG